MWEQVLFTFCQIFSPPRGVFKIHAHNRENEKVNRKITIREKKRGGGNTKGTQVLVTMLRPVNPNQEYLASTIQKYLISV